MNLPSRLALKRILVKEQPVLALDTGFEADSVEGLRLVKSSRGSGWFFHSGSLVPWTTRGVTQQDRRLVVWGELPMVPEGQSPEVWPQEGEAGREFLKSFVQAWTALALKTPLEAFGPSSVLPFQTADGWAFVFLPAELRSVLDSLQPRTERLAWEHFFHSEASGEASWAFVSAALAANLASGTLVWAQEDEEHLRQEIRDLKKTLVIDELPSASESLRTLWWESLTGRGKTAARWRQWAAEASQENLLADPEQERRRAAALARRERRRGQGAFWRRKGTLITSALIGAAAVLLIVGSVVWGAVKPDPTDTWTPEQVVQGYYSALDKLDDQQLGKLTSFDSSKEPVLQQDKDEVTNRYVIRQVRTAYEQKSPILDASAWEAAGKPPLVLGQMLYGLIHLQREGAGERWLVRYQKWTSEGGGDKTVPKAVGAVVADQVALVKTGRGWKVSSLRRQTQPLL